MSGELGLQTSFRERVYGPLSAFRGGDNSSGQDITLLDFMNKRLKMRTPTGKELDWSDIFKDLGKDPRDINLDYLLTISGDVKYLVPEIIRDFILKGLESKVNYTDLIAGTEPVSEMSVTTPWIQYDNEKPVRTGEAETIAEAGITWGRKEIRVYKKAIALNFSDELLLSVKIPLLKYFLRKVGVQIGLGLYSDAVQTMVNGDQADGSDACAVVGTTTGTTLTFADFLRLWVRAQLVGMDWNNLINCEMMANEVLQLDEFSKPQGLGGTVVNLQSRNRIIPANLPHFVSSAMEANSNMLFDQAASLVYLVFRGLLVEAERIVMRQVQGTAVSYISGFATIDRASRIILKKNVTFAANGFPDFMKAAA